ncbi:hypothetical protein EGW08_000563 [Elysia chlorotica]|uniref:Uncharacterized protein n=1 Tax=Elysia chlorotica TaxID=188477 RepID=A0A433UCY9_ELYCH|nr:hypothetical protein EGW08_000563 [Elysia chlorotica]
MGQPKPAVTTQRVLHYPGKIPSISLGLPELPSGLRTTKAFSYKRQDLDFSLGPVITPPSSYRSSEGVAYSDHGTTVKVNVSSTMPGMPDSHYRDDDFMAIHCVSPALSTNVPVPPAGTPATFAHGSPTKSAPAGPLQQQYSWDTTRVTINWSQSALPPSPGVARGDSAQVARLLSTPQREGEGEGLERELTPGEDRALDTINETAREGAPAELAGGGATPVDTDTKHKAAEGDGATVPRATTLQLETSTLKRIGAGASPRKRSARSVESCPSPEQWPLVSESSFENLARPSVSEPALSARSDRRRPISRDSRKDLAARRAMDDNKMKTESPAPPPPSPEPKDHPGESRMRKDLRSRDSLTMAPLFEVAELDEGSPVRDESWRHPSRSTRAVGSKHSKKIEVTVPAESEDVAQDGEKAPEDKGDEMISQMTIMHVIPKGRRPGEKRGRELDRVQETFLNVDIPAEDVSSVKAEHGSSHQEDLSSNDTVVKSHTTGSEVSVTPRAGPPILEENTELGEGRQQEQGQELSVEGREKTETADQEEEYEKGETSNLDKSQTNVLNSYRDMLDVSDESPELLCDSARFVSHDQVSPVEGEELGGSHRFVLGELEGLGDDNDGTDAGGKPKGNISRKESLLGNLTRRLDKDSDGDVGEERDGESVYDDGDGTASGIEMKADENLTEPDTQPPGVFFFQGSTPSEDSSDGKTHGPEDAAENDAQEAKEKNKDEAAEAPSTVTDQPEQTNVGSGEEASDKTGAYQAEDNKDEQTTETNQDGPDLSTESEN